MKKLALGALLWVCSTRVCLAFDDWSKADYALAGGAFGVMVLDWGQTRYAAKHPKQFTEVGSSSFIGTHPTVGRTNVYFAESTLFYGGVSYLLPAGLRKVFLGGEIIWRLDAVTHNRGLGVRFNF